MPPSTSRVAPVIHEARSEQRNATASATSAGSPILPSGWWEAAASSSCHSTCEKRVLTTPGATATTRTAGASSEARCLVMWIRPALEMS